MTAAQRSGFLPEDIEYQATTDAAYFICGAIASVATAALLGGLLAMILVLLFLGSLRKSFVLGLSIPIAIMATFALMGLGNLTLNIISLGGLALGVGLLLDNGIVMLENIYRHRDELGRSADDAAHSGAAEVRSAEVADAETLGTLLLFRHQGEPVLLRDIARFELGTGPAHIERENQSRIERVVGDINTQISDVGTIIAEVDRRLQGMVLPDQYSLIFGGQWEAIQETNKELLRVISLALFLVFVVLAVQYERLVNPLVILCAAPMSLVGVVAMLWVTGTPLSTPVMIGVVLLIGIVVNNTILLVEYIEIGRRDHGLDIRDAILEAGGVRLRPILMTTLTKVIGMLPLAIGLGQGAEIMRPLAIAVIGGLLGAMLLTLIVVPCLYMVGNRGADWLKRKLTI